MRSITKNMASLMIRREELFSRYSKVYINAKYLTDLRYRLGYLSDDFLRRRINFLKDYIRRSETISLRNRSRLKKSFGQRVFSWSNYYGDYHALDLYLQRLLVNNSLLDQSSEEEEISPRNYLEKVKKQYKRAKINFRSLTEK